MLYWYNAPWLASIIIAESEQRRSALHFRLLSINVRRNVFAKASCLTINQQIRLFDFHHPWHHSTIFRSAARQSWATNQLNLFRNSQPIMNNTNAKRRNQSEKICVFPLSGFLCNLMNWPMSELWCGSAPTQHTHILQLIAMPHAIRLNESFSTTAKPVM